MSWLRTPRTLGSESDDAPPSKRSTHPTVVEYAIRELFKGKSPAAAAKHTVKKLSGAENLFLGPGVVFIDADELEEAVWGRLVGAVIEAIGKVKEGKEHYALDGVVQQFRQTPKARAELKRRVIEKLGRNPFPNDETLGNVRRRRR